MPIFTYFNDNEIKAMKVTDPQICEHLDTIHNRIGKQFIVNEQKFITKRLFRKDEVKFLYTVYVKSFESEYQILTFCGTSDFNGCKMSYQTDVSKEILINYLLGFLVGLDWSAGQR